MFHDISRGHKWPVAVFECRCGEKFVARVTNVKHGTIATCGCSRKSTNVILVDGVVSARHPLYFTWGNMVARCERPSASKYENYGGRGISVCDRWRRGEHGMTGFQCFVADMGERPEGLELDRADNNGNYEPVNCRWVTRSQQLVNRSNTLMLTVDGVTLPLKEHAEIRGLSYTLVFYRKYRGWPDRECVYGRSK